MREVGLDRERFVFNSVVDEWCLVLATWLPPQNDPESARLFWVRHGLFGTRFTGEQNGVVARVRQEIWRAEGP